MDPIRAEAQVPGPFPRQGGEEWSTSLSALDRFLESMHIDYERWREGIGYDLEVIRTATPKERSEIERLLLSRPIEDWRDVEALAALNSPKAKRLLKTALKEADHKIVMAIQRHAPDLLSKSMRIKTLVAALEESVLYAGFSEALDQVEEFHPPEVVQALLRGARKREGEVAVHFAAMLMYIHGKAESAFDWNLRPFFLRFHTQDQTEREAVYRELCEKIGVNPSEGK